MGRGGLLTVVIIMAGLAAGFSAGLAFGWWWPIKTQTAGPAALAPMWQSDYILMTAQAYSLDGDLGLARQRLGELGPTDSEGVLGELVAQRGQAAIEEGLPVEDIARLARLAAALGARQPELEPYLVR